MVDAGGLCDDGVCLEFWNVIEYDWDVLGEYALSVHAGC